LSTVLQRGYDDYRNVAAHWSDKPPIIALSDGRH